MSVDPAVLLEMLQAHDNPRRGQWVRGNRSIVMLAFDHASPIRSAEQGFLSMTPCGIWSGYSQLPFSHLELFPVSFSNTNDSRGPTMIHHVPSYERLKSVLCPERGQALRVGAAAAAAAGRGGQDGGRARAGHHRDRPVE